jgi:hypothetical protein
MSGRGFPADDLVTNALKAMYELHTEMQCRSIDGKGREEKPPVDLLSLCQANTSSVGTARCRRRNG